jgi:two-component system, LuxR family, response regulator FixJ
MPEPRVHVIDDDNDARESLSFLLSSSDIAVTTYASARAFLDVAARVRGVVVTDFRMPEMDGLQMVRRLTEIGVALPVIVVTGHRDVPLAVEAMKAGAVDFIEKPYSDEAVLRAIRGALMREQRTEAQHGNLDKIRQRIAGLSPRERQVLTGLVAGKPNKVMAHDLSISSRTVEIYRANVMIKMRAQSLAELVRLVLSVGAAPPA